MGIPTDLSWSGTNGVLTQVGDLLANPLVVSAITAALALRFGPRIIKAVFRATKSS